MCATICRFQNKQGHHREQQTERIEREGQRNRPQNAVIGISGTPNNGGAVSNVNNRVGPGFSRPRDSRDGDEYSRSVFIQTLQIGISEIL